MRQAARVNVAACALLSVLGVVSCGSSPNGPTGVYADAATTGDADATVGDAHPFADETGVGLGCPSSYTARAEGTPCFSILTACDFPEGRCGCLVCELGATSFSYTWSCRPWESGGVGCPARAPAMGSPCDGEGLVCRYAAYCSVSVGDDLECRGGTWQPAAARQACGYRTCPA
jgi:hypothetical protein